MIAGFIGAYSRTKDPIEAFKWGVACGSATAFSDDLAARELIDELLPEVEITKLISFKEDNHEYQGFNGQRSDDHGFASD